MNTDRRHELGARIIVDLLDVRADTDIAATIARRVNHLKASEQVHVLAQSLGIAALILGQVRDLSTTGEDVLTVIRNGLMTDIVANNLLKGNEEDGN